MRLPVDELVRKYKDNLFRAAFSICRNTEDAEDVVQDTYIQYMDSSRQFESEEHIKAWLLRTAINKSKNTVRSFWRRNRGDIGEYLEEIPFPEPEDRQLVEAVMSLPQPYRIVIHLYYQEDYPVKDIARILNIPAGTVKSRLARGRKILKDILGED